jgi:hypothetical protein
MSESSESSDYTSTGTIKKCDDAKKLKKLKLFYKEEFLNNSGLTLDSNERYTEVIAGWVIKKLEEFKQIEQIYRITSYCTNGHDGKNNPASKSERNIAKRIFLQGKKEGISGIGLILDYETPLRNIRSDEVGNIDLLAFDREKKVLRILELKQPNNINESMLRCVLEAYTYLRLVDKEKLIDDFNREKHVNIPSSTVFVACPLVFRNSVQHKELQEMQEGLRPNLKKLIEQLEVRPMIIEKNETIYSAYELEL